MLRTFEAALPFLTIITFLIGVGAAIAKFATKAEVDGKFYNKDGSSIFQSRAECRTVRVDCTDRLSKAMDALSAEHRALRTDLLQAHQDLRDELKEDRRALREEMKTYLMMVKSSGPGGGVSQL